MTLIKELEQKQADVAATLAELKDIRRQCLSYLAENGVRFSQEASPEGESAPKRSRRSSQSKD